MRDSVSLPDVLIISYLRTFGGVAGSVSPAFPPVPTLGGGGGSPWPSGCEFELIHPLS